MIRSATTCVAFLVCSFSCTSVDAQIPPPFVDVIEYYNAEMDHYFITPLANETALCDAGLPPCQGWVRTGEVIRAFAAGYRRSKPNEIGTITICRFFNDSYAGKSTHFYYAPELTDCVTALEPFPGWKLETLELFDANEYFEGQCVARNTQELFRLYNNGIGGAPNHRYTTSTAIVTQMIAKGWVLEGPAMCVPTSGYF